MNDYQAAFVYALLVILGIFVGMLLLALLINVMTFFISPAIRRFWKIYFEVKNEEQEE